MDEARITHPQIVEFVTTTPWAILPAKLSTIMSVVEAKLFGEDVLAAAQQPVVKEYDQPYTLVDGVAVIPVYGTLLPRAGGIMALSGLSSLQKTQAALATALDDQRAHSIILEFDSPGGSAAGIPELGQMIYDSRAIKPIHALANSMMASAAYWLGSQAESISVTPSGQVGSIGVIMAHIDESKAFAQRGIKVSYITAGKYKAEGARTEPLSAEARAHYQGVVDALYGEFIETVARGRGMSVEMTRKNSGEARMFRPAEALERGLVDRVETIHEMIARLNEGKSRSASASVVPMRVAAQAFSEGVSLEEEARRVYTIADTNSITANLNPPIHFQPSVPNESGPDAGQEHHGGDDMPEANEIEVAVNFEVEGLEEAEAKIAALAAQIEAITQERDAAVASSDALAGRVTSLETERRKERMTNIVMGRGGESDGLRFFGDVEAHVNLLMSLSKAFGEDSAEVKAYIEQQQKVAAAMNESALLETVGHGREPKVGATAYEQFMLLVQDERELAAKAGDPIAEADAIERAARKNPRLYNQYTRESAQRV